jgi:molecular chaperone DnaK
VRELVKTIFGKDPNMSINPDEVVAVGAAVQGAVLSAAQTGEKLDILLLDVTPLSLGVETLGNVMDVIIPRNTTIPKSERKVYSTAADNQPAVEIHVLQGERSMASDNRTLGRFQLTGIPPAPRGMPQVEVTFDIDANGILNVSAKDLGTGKEQKVEIKAKSGLTEDEINRMVKDAEAHASEDKAKKKIIDLRNQADQAVYTTEKSLKDHGDKVDAATRGEIEQALNRVKDVQKSDDAGAIEKAMENLQTVSHKLAEAVYKATAAKGGAPSAGGAPGEEPVGAGVGDAGGAPSGSQPGKPGGKDDVIDAEFEVKS